MVGMGQDRRTVASGVDPGALEFFDTFRARQKGSKCRKVSINEDQLLTPGHFRPLGVENARAWVNKCELVPGGVEKSEVLILVTTPVVDRLQGGHMTDAT